jgi:hypothetical protein
MTTLLEKLDACPPFLCYYGAHMGRERRPTADRLIADSGLSARTFMRISQRLTWADVTVSQATQFAHACGVDLLNPQPLQAFIGEQVQSGKLLAEFNKCGGAGERMLAQFNLLCGKAVLAKENAT